MDVSKKSIAVTIRLDEETANRVDAHIEELRAAVPRGVRIGQADALRSLIERGLDCDDDD